MSSFIEGYHILRNVWLPVLDIWREMDTSKPLDEYPVTVKKTINWWLKISHLAEMINLRKLFSTSSELTHIVAFHTQETGN